MTHTETNLNSRNGQSNQAGFKPLHEIILEQLGQEFCDRHLLNRYAVERSGMLLEELQIHAEPGTVNRLLALIGCELAALSMVNPNALPIEAAKRIKGRIGTLVVALENAHEAVGSQLEVLQAVQNGLYVFPANPALKQQSSEDTSEF